MKFKANGKTYSVRKKSPNECYLNGFRTYLQRLVRGGRGRYYEVEK